MIVIPDIRQIIMVAAGRKQTHRFPAGTTKEGWMRHPKIATGKTHSIYERAPHGRFGNRSEPPLVSVEIDRVDPSTPMEWTDEEMYYEGFDSVEAYGVWWDVWRKGDRLCKAWNEMSGEPFWVTTFRLVGFTDYFKRRLEIYHRDVSRG